MSIITLTTDFGTRDCFVGAMKGVILGIKPDAIIVDLVHDVSGGDIRSGAFSLMGSYSLFTKGTVHVAVIDPGVGSSRHALAVQTANYFFVGPDNGVLSFALAREKIKSVHSLENEDYFLKPVSRTFHGRDIFAPVAAHLSSGVPIEKLGPVADGFIKIAWPQVRTSRGRIEGEVIYVDRFGNLITNIGAEDLRILGDKPCEVFAGNKRVCPIAPFYGAVAVGRPLGLVGSTGFLEIAINGASAAEKFRLGVGRNVDVRPWVKSR